MFLTDIDLTKWMTASAVLVVLLFLFAYAVRYVSHKQPQTAFGMKRKRLKLVETLHLDARNKVCIIEMDQTEIILSVGANGTETIGTQEKTEVNETEIPIQNCEPSKIEGIGFLKRFIKKSCTTNTAEVTDKKDKK